MPLGTIGQSTGAWVRSSGSGATLRVHEQPPAETLQATGSAAVQNVHVVAAKGSPSLSTPGSLGGPRFTEDRNAHRALGKCGGDDDREVDNGHEDSEVDDRRDESAEVDELPVDVDALAQPPQSGNDGAARSYSGASFAALAPALCGSKHVDGRHSRFRLGRTVAAPDIIQPLSRSSKGAAS